MNIFLQPIKLISLFLLSGLAVAQEPVTGYVHKWLEAPEIRGADVYSGAEKLFKAQKGRMAVIVFTASWCEPCGHITPELLRAEARYAPYMTDFLYIFSHDSAADAKKAADKAGMKNALLTNQEILSFFHNPELPAIYLVDRRGWLFHKMAKPKVSDLSTLKNLVETLTAF